MSNSENEIEINYKNKYVYQFFKRFFDILFSSIFLILFGWLILLLILIKYVEEHSGKCYKLEVSEDVNGKYLSKNGKRYNCKVYKDPNGKKDKTCKGAIYTSYRCSKNGKLVKFHKIRSMYPGSEQMKETLIAYGINESDEPAFKLKDDPRITKFGKFLRKTSLDELPQIWDIFVGRLAIVGPRSPILSEVEQYNDYQKNRLLVKGGLLCLWQIQKNRNSLSFNDWVNLDITYINKRSLWLDFKIIVIGFFMVIFDRSGE